MQLDQLIELALADHRSMSLDHRCTFESSQPGIVCVHPTGNANSRAALEGFYHEGLLAEFHTALALFPGNMWSRLARIPVGQELQRREFPESLRGITRQRPARELLRMLFGKLGATSMIAHESGPFCIDAIYRDMDRVVAKRVRSQVTSGVYAYEDGALESFRAAKESGSKCLYDLPIGYWRTARRSLSEESQRWPQWAATMPGFQDSEEKLNRKDEELRLADAIFAASSFTAKSLADYPDEKIAPVHVIPYGFPTPVRDRVYDNVENRKLRLLFVGGLSQRKGIADVFAVADALSHDVELTVVGRGRVEQCPALRDALSRHRWIPSLSHPKVLEQMRAHDVLLFPSLFEGFGLVITEAMSQGTPAITTDRTAGADILEHGKSGWLVPAGNTQALMRQVEALLDDPNKVGEAGKRAVEVARARPWSIYGIELATKVADVIRS